jgi:sulfur-carrier protein
MRVVYLGKLADVAGIRTEEILLPPTITTSASLRTWLDETRAFHGALLHRSVRMAVNNEIVVDHHPIFDHDEIALLPPVSGG